jgi:hypothetical protein
MAIVTSLVPLRQETFKPHPTAVECRYAIFSVGKQQFVQLNTYGSPDRQDAGTVSQTLQFDEASARELRRVLDEAFPA